MYTPYRTWFTTSSDGKEVGDGGGFLEAGDGEDGVERVWELMRKAGGGFVGVMGFSQGTRIAGGLLLDQQKRKEGGFKNEGEELRFGVMCMGGGAPMVSAISRGLTPLSLPFLCVDIGFKLLLEFSQTNYGCRWLRKTRLNNDTNSSSPWSQRSKSNQWS